MAANCLVEIPLRLDHLHGDSDKRHHRAGHAHKYLSSASDEFLGGAAYIPGVFLLFYQGSGTHQYFMRGVVSREMRKLIGSMKKFVCLGVLKPNSIMQHESDSEHSTPLFTFPRGAGCKIQHIDCKTLFGNKM